MTFAKLTAVPIMYKSHAAVCFEGLVVIMDVDNTRVRWEGVREVIESSSTVWRPDDPEQRSARHHVINDASDRVPLVILAK